jgi:hypothetical protein
MGAGGARIKDEGGGKPKEHNQHSETSNSQFTGGTAEATAEKEKENEKDGVRGGPDAP